MNRTKLIDAGKPFKFNAENVKIIDQIFKKYPENRRQSALLPLLDLAQRQNENWISREVVETIAATIGIAPIRVFEVASFYTMYNLEPVGRHLVQVCRTTPCWLRGSEEILSACKKAAGVEHLGERSKDGAFTVVEVECMGACANAPMVQINDDYYEDLTPDAITVILKDLKAGKSVKAGSCQNRVSSEPLGIKATATPKSRKSNPKEVNPDA